MPRKKTNTLEVKENKTSSLTAEIFDMEGKVTESIELPKEVFASVGNDKLIAQSARVFLSNQRQGNASTKTRADVAGSTKKVYRQKGTGRARHGSIKAPIYVGGGIVFGPHPRDFSLKMPRKMRKKALFYTLTTRFNNKNVLVMESLKKDQIKTQKLFKAFKNLNLEIKNDKLANQTLLVSTKDQRNIALAARNIENLVVTKIDLLNPYLILTSSKIIFTKEAMEAGKTLWNQQTH